MGIKAESADVLLLKLNNERLQKENERLRASVAALLEERAGQYREITVPFDLIADD